MNYFVGLGLGLGTAVGTLLFTGLLSAAHEFDWGRALFVGLFVGLAGAVFSLLTQKKTRSIGSAFAAVNVRFGSGAACRDTSRVFRIGNLLCWFDRPQSARSGLSPVRSTCTYYADMLNDAR